MSTIRPLLLAAAIAALAVPASSPSAVRKPPPPPDWSSQLTHSALVAGGVTTFSYRVDSRDGFDLTVSVQQTDGLRLLKTGTSRYSVVAARPTWVLRFTGREAATRSVRLRLRVPAGSAGRRLCLTLRQVARNGGVPDILAKRSCGTVAAP